MDPRDRKPIPHLPKPFSRPSIDITNEKRREWQWINPKFIKENDILPDMGLIQEVINLTPTDNIIRIVGTSTTNDFEADKKVWAFSRKP